MPPVHRVVLPGEVVVDVTDHARLYTVNVTANAEEGSVGASSQTLDDPEATLDLTGLNAYRILEDTATGSNQYIWVGHMGTRTYRRSQTSLRTGVQREIEVELQDANNTLNRYMITESWGNRPAETDVQRVQAVVSNGGIINLGDTRFFSSSNPFSMPAQDFRGQTVYSILDDCAQESGKNWFIWWAGDTEDYSLWYDFDSSTNYSSPLRLSNVLSDIDGVWTFEISSDTELSRDPSRVYSHIYLPWLKGAAFVESIPTALEFGIRHGTMDGYNVRSQTQANTRANRYLAQADSEEDVVTTTVRLPAAKVNFLMQGMRVQFKATHLPGYADDFSWFRVLRRTVTQEDELNYSVRLEMVGTPSSSRSCAVSLAALDDQISGPLTFTPVEFTISETVDAPFLTIACCAVGATGAFSNGGSLVAAAPWTSLGPIPGVGGATHTESALAYRSNAAGEVVFSWASTGVGGGGYIQGVCIPTTATAPTQLLQLDGGTGADIIFPSPPAAGSMLFLFRVAEGPTGWAGVPGGADWVLVSSVDGYLPNPNANQQIWVCCTPDNLDTLSSNTAGSSWWAHVLEIEIT